MFNLHMVLHRIAMAHVFVCCVSFVQACCLFFTELLLRSTPRLWCQTVSLYKAIVTVLDCVYEHLLLGTRHSIPEASKDSVCGRSDSIQASCDPI